MLQKKSPPNTPGPYFQYASRKNQLKCICSRCIACCLVPRLRSQAPRSGPHARGPKPSPPLDPQLCRPSQSLSPHCPRTTLVCSLNQRHLDPRCK